MERSPSRRWPDAYRVNRYVQLKSNDTKAVGVETVVGSVRAAARGESVLDPSVAAKLLHERRRRRDGDPVDQLSPREVDVLTALARGRSNKEIAQDLSIGEETVKTHVSNILSKLHLADRTQVAIRAAATAGSSRRRPRVADSPRIRQA